MTSFASRPARRRLVALAATSVLVGVPMAMPVAQADEDLRERKERVEGDIERAQEHLDQSSEQVAQTTQALEVAEAKLDVAQAKLAKTRGELAAAEALDRRMQAQLAAAVRRLQEARAELAEGRAEVAEQEEELGRIAVQTYQSGDPDLLGLSMMLTSQDPAQLTNQLGSVKSILDKEAVTLDRLDATRMLLAARADEVRAMKQEVARHRARAAENLEHKQALEAQASAAKAEVAALTADRKRSYAAAAKAQAEDRERLAVLERERAEITAVLQRRARRAERLAAATRSAGRPSAPPESSSPEPSSGGVMMLPVNGYLTSSFGMRFHPVYHRMSLHDGTDYGAACGTPVHAATSGTVVSASMLTGYGNQVLLDHGYLRGTGVATSYNHLSSFAVSPGQRVQQGQVIGYVGNTGYSTGCHLHFMVYENGTPVNPVGWL